MTQTTTKLPIRKYHVLYTLEDPTDHTIAHFERDPYFATDPDDYGNGTYLWWDFREGYDLRYERDYNPRFEFGYLADFMNRRWTGEGGSWRLVSVTITRIVEEAEQ